MFSCEISTKFKFVTKNDMKFAYVYFQVTQKFNVKVNI